MENLLKSYGIRSLNDTAEQLREDVSVVQSQIEIIRQTNQRISAGISRLQGQYESIHKSIVPELRKVCATDSGPAMSAECLVLKVSPANLSSWLARRDGLIGPFFDRHRKKRAVSWLLNGD